MPRFDRENTPPELRRAPRGDVLRGDSGRPLEGRFPHTAESLSNFQALKARWGLSDAETFRKALDKAVSSGE